MPFPIFKSSFEARSGISTLNPLALSFHFSMVFNSGWTRVKIQNTRELLQENTSKEMNYLSTTIANLSLISNNRHDLEIHNQNCWRGHNHQLSSSFIQLFLFCKKINRLVHIMPKLFLHTIIFIIIYLHLLIFSIYFWYSNC